MPWSARNAGSAESGSTGSRRRRYSSSSISPRGRPRRQAAAPVTCWGGVGAQQAQGQSVVGGHVGPHAQVSVQGQSLVIASHLPPVVARGRGRRRQAESTSRSSRTQIRSRRSTPQPPRRPRRRSPPPHSRRWSGPPAPAPAAGAAPPTPGPARRHSRPAPARILRARSIDRTQRHRLAGRSQQRVGEAQQVEQFGASHKVVRLAALGPKIDQPAVPQARQGAFLRSHLHPAPHGCRHWVAWW